MKKLILTAFALTAAASVFAQGTIVFNTGESTVKLHIYAPLASNTSLSVNMNGTADTPAGTYPWVASGFVNIGAAGTGGQYGGSTTFAELLAAPGTGDAASALQPATAGGITTFHTGTAVLGGEVIGLTSTFNNITPDYSGGATVEVVAWDDSSGQYSTWATASVAWKNGLIAAGMSAIGNITGAIGGTGTPPQLPTTLDSFNLYDLSVPEPGTFALAGLGLATLLVFRRRNS